MNTRGFLAAGILVAWGAGIAAFAQRELSRSPRERLAEAAARVAPGATYFAVEREGKHIGFASTTIDTVPGGLQATDYFVADLDSSHHTRRTTAQSVVHLTRGLALKDFTVTYGHASSPTVVSGKMTGDSLLSYSIRAPGSAAVARQVAVSAPLLLPTQIPFALTLGDAPRRGASRTFDTFDPLTLAVRAVTYTIVSDSAFVIVDSASYDGVTKRWAGVHADTVHGWHIVSDGAEPTDAWADDLGRLIALRDVRGLNMRRVAYEMAFENWRNASVVADERRADADDALGARTAIASGIDLRRAPLAELRVQIPGVMTGALAVSGGNQSVAGDTIRVTRDDSLMLLQSFPLPPSKSVRLRFANELRAEPLVETDHPAIVALAQGLRAGEMQTGWVVARITRWVHDSVVALPSDALPTALGTLRLRAGDCDDHTQLFVALARAAGIPTRAVSGILLVDGHAYYHSWAEVMLRRWVPVDPTMGQLPADASHIRLVAGGVPARAELARVIARLHPLVVATTPHRDSTGARPSSRAAR